VPADRFRERADDGAARSLFARGAEHGQHQLPKAHAAAPRRGLRMRAGGAIEPQAHEIDAREQGIHGLDAARIDVDDERPLVGDNEQRQRPVPIRAPRRTAAATPAGGRQRHALLQQESYSKVLRLMSECNYARRQNEFEAISSQLPVFCNSDATPPCGSSWSGTGAAATERRIAQSTGFRSESKTVWVERRPGEAQPVTVTIGKSDDSGNTDSFWRPDPRRFGDHRYFGPRSEQRPPDSAVRRFA
jgi:hypothetical protein